MPCTRINPPSCELYVERAPMPPVGRSSSGRSCAPGATTYSQLAKLATRDTPLQVQLESYSLVLK